MRVLYIGGTGEISLACVEAAKRAGHEVTVYNRGRRFDADLLGIRQIIGDFTDHATYVTLASGGFDVVCQFLAFSPDSVERDIDTFAGRCGQYVFISTASAYRKPIPTPLIVEDTPLGNPFWAYSRSKAECEARLLEAHRSGRLPVTIVRPSHTYRERLPSTVVHGDHLAWRLLNGKPVIVHGDGESVWTLTHADDFARAFVRICGNERAIGECIHIMDRVGHTWNAIMRTIEHVSGLEAQVCHVLSKTLVEYDPSWEGPLLGDKSNSMIFDTEKIQRLAGDWRCDVSLEEGIRRTWPLVRSRVEDGYRPDETIDALVDRIVKEHLRAR